MRAYLAMAVSYVSEMFMKLTPGIIVIKYFFFFATDSGTKKAGVSGRCKPFQPNLTLRASSGPYLRGCAAQVSSGPYP